MHVTEIDLTVHDYEWQFQFEVAAVTQQLTTCIRTNNYARISSLSEQPRTAL